LRRHRDDRRNLLTRPARAFDRRWPPYWLPAVLFFLGNIGIPSCLYSRCKPGQAGGVCARPSVPESDRMKKICIIGASGKLGQYMVQHALDRGDEVVAVCRAGSVSKLDRFKTRIAIVPGATDDRPAIGQAVAGCDGVLTVLVPWGMKQYASGTAQAVLDLAPPGARLVFSCGWNISRDGKDVFPPSIRLAVALGGRLLRWLRIADIDDQVEACRRIFGSQTRWTVVRGSRLEEGESEGLPVWSHHVDDAILRSNLTRRIDFARFMLDALDNDALIRQAPAITGCRTASAMAQRG
jgi:hypothetical protein